MTPAAATVMEPRQHPGISEQPTPARLPNYFVPCMGVFIVSVSLLLIYLLVRVWPGTVPAPLHGWVSLAWGNHLRFDLWIETRYLLIVALAGALGSFVHAATSFADFVGNRRLARSWAAWYVLRPFIGMALALVVYFALRAGLTTGASSAENLNLYGVAGTAGMCGMFSKQATDKLREVFENLFHTHKETERADPLALQVKPEERVKA